MHAPYAHDHNGKIVTCPVHGMKFDVTTGCFVGTSDFGVASFPAKVVDGKIIMAFLPPPQA